MTLLFFLLCAPIIAFAAFKTESPLIGFVFGAIAIVLWSAVLAGS